MNESSPARAAPRGRTARLVAIIALLRDGQLHLARDLARRFGTSVRTIYRDMDTLVASGVPVLGRRGEGYRMGAQVTLPALNLSLDEMEALHLGIAVMTEASDPQLRGAAKSLAEKLDAALPENRTGYSTSWGLSVYPFADTAAGIRHMPMVRASIRQRRKLRMRYRFDDGEQLASVIRPLKLDYWGRVWTCQAWCESTRALMHLRLDRIEELEELPVTFSPGKEIPASG